MLGRVLEPEDFSRLCFLVKNRAKLHHFRSDHTSHVGDVLDREGRTHHLVQMFPPRSVRSDDIPLSDERIDHNPFHWMLRVVSSNRYVLSNVGVLRLVYEVSLCLTFNSYMEVTTCYADLTISHWP
jgi:hypothetical protein